MGAGDCAVFFFEFAQPPVQLHRQLSGHRHDGDLAAAAEGQTLINPLQRGIFAHGDPRRFDQQPAHHAIALFADVAEALLAAAAAFAGIQAQ